MKGDDSYQWQRCLNRLSTMLTDVCFGYGVKKVSRFASCKEQLKFFFTKTGELLYCKARGKTRCCFEKEKCVKNVNAVNDVV